MEPYTESRMDELPCPASETSIENRIAGSLTSSEFGTENNEEITERQSMENHIAIDVPDHDEVLPCSDETSTADNDQKILLEKINGGIGRVNTDHHHQDHDDQWWYNKTPCIYKVEQSLKKVHGESTFHPKVVSIGPFHRNISTDHLKPMEQHKWRYLSDFLKSMNLTSGSGSDSDSDSSTNGVTTTDDDDAIAMTEKKQCLVASMQKLEAKARASYSEKFDDLGSNEFVMMMVLDGCFIIQLLLEFQLRLEFSKSGSRHWNDVDSLFSWRSRLPNLRHDLLLLENQLPFIVLEEIFTMSGIDKGKYELTDLILDFANPVLYREKKVLDQCKEFLNRCPRHSHLLEVFMSSFQRKIFYDCIQSPLEIETEHQKCKLASYQKPLETETEHQKCKLASYQKQKEKEKSASYYPEYLPDDGQDQDTSIHCVTELREAGVEFEKRDHHDLLDIEFKNGKLHIPPLFIDGNTVPVLLNFIAYEQRHRSIQTYFTSYLMFLDYLVNSSKDVEHLHYKGIINHGLGSDEQVATLFNKLFNEVVLELGENDFLSPVFKEVNKYFSKRRYRWRAAWKHEYFRNPWAFSSFLAAIVLLVLTFLQTFFSMYAYFHPP